MESHDNSNRQTGGITYSVQDLYMTRAEQNLLLLQNMIPRSEKLYVWCYQRDGSYTAASCPPGVRGIFQDAFAEVGGLQRALDYIRNPGNTRPVLIGSPIGMQWALTCETERSRDLVFVIGPVFYQHPSRQQLHDALRPYRRTGCAWATALEEMLEDLPVIAYTVFTRYVMMIHNTLTGQQLDLDALYTPRESAVKVDYDPAGSRDRTRVYKAEQALLRMVRTGDINYQSALLHSANISPGVPVQGRDPLRQQKISIIVFTTLVCRAAMEGGLSPEVAYPLGDSYIQAAEECRDSGNLHALTSAMYHDFIYRVHHLHMNPDYSPAVQKCCDYIELSLDRTIRAADLAALVGYSEYYITEKFKKETGLSVSEYARRARIERAKVLLRTTDLSVTEIAERLAFSTPGYFVRCFREAAGCTPARFRRNPETV